MSLTANEISLFVQAIKESSDYDFSSYSIKSFTRRIEKILSDKQLTIYELINKIKRSPNYLEQTVKDITVNTTELFRDPPIWHAIRQQALSKFRTKRQIAIWHAGCSTGQEVYSMLALLNEENLLERSRIFATDLNTDVLEVARKGVYKRRIIDEYMENYHEVLCENPLNYDDHKNVPHKKYFKYDTFRNTFEAKRFMKQRINFKKHDLISLENPFEQKYDMIICRNVMIYFNHQLQNQVFEFFHQILTKNGMLVLGVHEGMLGSVASKFRKNGQIYTKIEDEFTF